MKPPLVGLEVDEQARFRVEWMAKHLAEAQSDYDLEEHFGLQLMKAYAAGDRTEELVNAAAYDMVSDPRDERITELRRRQVAWRALRMKTSRRREVPIRSVPQPAARARSPRGRTRRTRTSSSSSGDDPPDGDEPHVGHEPGLTGRLGVGGNLGTIVPRLVEAA